MDGAGTWRLAEVDRSSTAEPNTYCLDGPSGSYSYDGAILHTVGDSFDGPTNVVLDRRVELVGDYYRIYNESDSTRCEGIYRRIAAPPTKVCE